MNKENFKKIIEKKWLVAFLVSLFTILVYLPALQNDFVNYDDDLVVYENLYIKSFDSALFKYMVSFKDAMWIPLTKLSHALNYAVWGLAPMGHHLSNIVFHGFNTFLVVILVVCLLENCNIVNSPFKSEFKEIISRNALIAGGLTGIFFGIHPLRVESVVWITERKDVLSGFFILLSLLCYLKFTAVSPVKRRSLYYSLCIILFIMALMSKPVVVTFPVILLILDVYPLERLKFDRGLKSQIKLIAEKVPFFALSLIWSLVTLLAYKAEEVAVTLKTHLGITGKVFMVLRSICFYLAKILWPVNLVPFYPIPKQISIFTFEYIGSLIIFLGITFYCIYRWRKQKIWSVVWVYFITTLLPVIGILTFSAFSTADRYTYLPSLGPSMLVGLGTVVIYRTFLRKQWIYPAKLFLLITFILTTSLLSILTIKQTGIWKDSFTLWNAQIKSYPDTYVAQNNLGLYYQGRGLFEKAREHYEVAIRLDPANPDPHNNLGVAYKFLGHVNKAIAQYEIAKKLDPNNPKTFNNLGIAYESQGLVDKAIKHYKTSIALKPDSPNAYYNLGHIYQLKDLNDEAIKHYKAAIRLNPDDSDAHNNLGVAYESQGFIDKAMKHYKIAAELKTDNLNARNNLTDIYKKHEDIEN
jgi:Flp pilus assembly protein TadD